jgi:hypothetical protein
MRNPMSLKVPPQWLAAPVPLYAKAPRKRRLRKPRPTVAIEPRVIARHGSTLILEVRDARGRKSLRYTKHAGNAP